MTAMKSLRIVLAVALMLALAIGTTGCNQEEIAAKVNGDEITVAELNVQIEQLKKQYPQMFEGADGEGRLLDFKQRLLDNLINQKLLEQAAEARKLEVSDDEVAAQIKQLKGDFKDEAQFTSALQSAGMTVDSLERQIKEQLLTQKIVESLSDDAKATPAEITAYYDKNKTQFFQKEAKRASHILFKPEDKAKAEAVLKQVKSGGDFAALAKQNSVDTATASKGGDLGWPTTPYVPEFEEALTKLEKGEVSKLVQTPYGWHIIKVTDERSGSQQKLEDVTEQIEQILVQQTRADAYQKFLDDLRKKAKIEILIEELKLNTESKATTGTK
jgi:foldase protein PrsA